MCSHLTKILTSEQGGKEGLNQENKLETNLKCDEILTLVKLMNVLHHINFLGALQSGFILYLCSSLNHPCNRTSTNFKDETTASLHLLPLVITSQLLYLNYSFCKYCGSIVCCLLSSRAQQQRAGGKWKKAVTKKNKPLKYLCRSET